MAIERTYTVPLRKAFQKAPKYRRAKKAVNALRAFIERHMKSDDVLIGPKLNLKIWENGIKNPPHHVKVTAIKDEKDNVVRVELFGFEFKPKEKKEKKDKPAPGLAGKLQEKLAAKDVKEEPKEKPTTKKDIKEVKKGVEKKADSAGSHAAQPEKAENPAVKKEEPKKAAVPKKAPLKKE
jgi:large subunit ribosomal protein L31e